MKTPEQQEFIGFNLWHFSVTEELPVLFTWSETGLFGSR